MTPREKEIALEAAGRSSEPVEQVQAPVEAGANDEGSQPEQPKVSALLAACREIIDRGEGGRSPENPGVTLRELLALHGYRPSRLEVLTQVVSRELVGRPLRIALVLLTCFGMSGAAIWLSLAALYAGAGK